MRCMSFSLVEILGVVRFDLGCRWMMIRELRIGFLISCDDRMYFF
jgi:hypothetical protein